MYTITVYANYGSVRTTTCSTRDLYIYLVFRYRLSTKEWSIDEYDWPEVDIMSEYDLPLGKHVGSWSGIRLDVKRRQRRVASWRIVLWRAISNKNKKVFLPHTMAIWSGFRISYLSPSLMKTIVPDEVNTVHSEVMSPKTCSLNLPFITIVNHVKFSIFKS